MLSTLAEVKLSTLAHDRAYASAMVTPIRTVLCLLFRDSARLMRSFTNEIAWRSSKLDF